MVAGVGEAVGVVLARDDEVEEDVMSHVDTTCVGEIAHQIDAVLLVVVVDAPAITPPQSQYVTIEVVGLGSL